MTLHEYQTLAARTMNKKLTKEQTIHHALFGLSAEVGEITSLFQKNLQGHEFIRGDLKKEIGDALWMLAELCTAYDMDLADVGQLNIDKLRKRYPDGFSEERSIHRAE